MAAAQALSFTPSGTVLYIALELGEGKWVTDQRFSGPIGTDQIEHPMFNRVPFGSAGVVTVIINFKPEIGSPAVSSTITSSSAFNKPGSFFLPCGVHP